MATHKPTSDKTAEIIKSPCNMIRLRIEQKLQQLNIWQSKLEMLLSNEASEVSEIGDLRELVKDIKLNIFNLKAEQIRLGCLSNGSSEFPQDNQTVLSTSSVRRKDSRALELAFDYSSQKANNINKP